MPSNTDNKYETIEMHNISDYPDNTLESNPQVTEVNNNLIIEYGNEKCASCCMGFLMGLFFNIFGLFCICCFRNKSYYLVGYFTPIIIYVSIIIGAILVVGTLLILVQLGVISQFI